MPQASTDPLWDQWQHGFNWNLAGMRAWHILPQPRGAERRAQGIFFRLILLPKVCASCVTPEPHWFPKGNPPGLDDHLSCPPYLGAYSK